MTTTALATAVGISERTLRNIACGSAPSRRAHQAITTTLGVEIWPGILPSERRLSFKRGDQTEFATIEAAKAAAREFRGHVKRRGTVVTFTRSVSFVVSYNSAHGARAPAAAKISESIRYERKPPSNDHSPKT